MSRSIYCGLQVRARAGSIGTASWNEGRVATVVNVFGNFATYSYGPGEITYRIELRSFWNRFERVETFGPYHDEEPQEYESIVQVPRGMVVQYTIDGHTTDAMLYPYIYRSEYGIYAYSRDAKEWVFVRWSHIERNHPWMLRLPTDFGTARLTEAFTYPHFPAMLRLQQWSIINA